MTLEIGERTPIDVGIAKMTLLKPKLVIFKT